MRVLISRNRLLVALAGGVVLIVSVVLVAILTRPSPQGQRNESDTGVRGSVAQADPSEESPRRITNGLGMEFVQIPAGRFVMGSVRGKPDEQPHVVHITRPFFLGVTEVTDWERGKMGKAASEWNPEWRVGRRPDDDRSASINSWQEASDLARSLSQVDPDYDYRLPTEAEWEYACRGKADVLEPSEHDIEVSQPHKREYGVIEPVKLEPPNAFGLYDMLRNDGEYCSDWYAADYYQNSPLENPKGPRVGRTRVARGVRSEGHDRSYSAWRRYHMRPGGDGNILIGVRFVLEKKKEKR